MREYAHIIHERQSKRFFSQLDTFIDGLADVPLGSAVAFLERRTGLLRVLVDKLRHVFARGMALSLRSSDLLARLCRHVFIKEELKVHFPEVRDWLYDNGYDESGQRKRTVLDEVEMPEEDGGSQI